MEKPLCPAGPKSIHKNLTALTSTYQLKAVLAVLAIVFFFVLYFGLVLAFAYLVKLAITYPIGDINKVTILVKLGAIAGSAMLFVFTLKFIFKLKSYKPENRIKLNKKEHPELFQFVNQICKETHAPRPKSIYIDPDVNAYVCYTNVWLSLFFPTRKELTIGLGLVSSLNLSEFKAVVAHEFGHFAQRSMKIGSYIVSANTIIHDMIFVRDKWDRLLEQWRGSDLRLSAAAWVITPVIWIIRQLLNLFYQFLNIMHSSLSREMEFNADKVAVSVTGSDAIVSSLWKLDSGSTIWNSTYGNAYHSSQKNLYIKNLYYHVGLECERGVESQNELLNNLPDDSRGGKKYFSVSENSKVSMYASHPRNDQREDNAKTPYIECEMDYRSPWLLFNSANEIQEKMTALVYEKYMQKKPDNYISADEFESFIKAETQGKNLLSEYYNTFEARYLEIPTEEDLKNAEPLSLSVEEATKQLKAELYEMMKPVQSITTLMTKAQEIAAGTTKDKSFNYLGVDYNKKNLNEGYGKLVQDRNILLNEGFVQWDVKFCKLHYALARDLNQEMELLSFYNQHRAITTLYKNFVITQSEIYNGLQQLRERDDVTQLQVLSFGDTVLDGLKALNKEFEKLNDLNFVPLPNIDSIQELKEAIIEGGAFKFESGPLFENHRFEKLMDALEKGIAHCQRVDQKSVSVILGFNKNLYTKAIASKVLV